MSSLSLFHMCQFGSAWKKPTAVLCGNMPTHLTKHISKCCQCKGSICGRTSKTHLQLIGTSPNGKPWTAIAQVYPKALCAALAKLFVHQVVSRLWFSQLVMHTYSFCLATTPVTLPSLPSVNNDTGFKIEINDWYGYFVWSIRSCASRSVASRVYQQATFSCRAWCHIGQGSLLSAIDKSNQ